MTRRLFAVTVLLVAFVLCGLVVPAVAQHRPPALLIVGETTRYADRYSWFAPSRVEHFADEPAETGRVSYLKSTNKAAP